MSYVTIEEYISLDIDLDDIFNQIDTKDLEKELIRRKEPNQVSLSDNGHTRQLTQLFKEILNDSSLNHLELYNKIEELLK